MPVILNESNDLGKEVADMLADYGDENAELVEVGLKPARRRMSDNRQEGWNYGGQKRNAFEAHGLEDIHDGVDDCRVIDGKRWVFYDCHQRINDHLRIVVFVGGRQPVHYE